MSSLPPNLNHDLVPNGNYGAWLHPFVDIASNDENLSRSQTQDLVEPNPIPESKPARRGRGRPRVSAARDATAIEKRRAQVRNAQRAYQERKDDAMATEKRKRDDVVQVLFDLSLEVEELFKIAVEAGIVHQENVLGIQLRRLCDTHEKVINSSCVEVDFKKLRSRNSGRRNILPSHANPLAIVAATAEVDTLHSTTSSDAGINSASAADLDLGGVNDTTIIAPYSHLRVSSQGNSKVMGGRSIFQVVADRQAAMRSAGNPPS